MNKNAQNHAINTSNTVCGEAEGEKKMYSATFFPTYFTQLR